MADKGSGTLSFIRMEILGIDIGGGSVKAALVDVVEGVVCGGVERWPTPTGGPAGEMVAGITQLRERYGKKTSVGIGFPGVIFGSQVHSAANLGKDWIGYDFSDLRDLWRTPIGVGNDADAAGMAEMMFGAGRALSNTVMVVTCGTGIGTALFSNGKLVPNTELGHLQWKDSVAEKYVSAAVKTREGLDYETWGTRLSDYLAELERLLSVDSFIIGGGISADFERFAGVLKTRAPVYPAQMGNDAGIVGAALFAARQVLG